MSKKIIFLLICLGFLAFAGYIFYTATYSPQAPVETPTSTPITLTTIEEFATSTSMVEVSVDYPVFGNDEFKPEHVEKVNREIKDYIINPALEFFEDGLKDTEQLKKDFPDWDRKYIYETGVRLIPHKGNPYQNIIVSTYQDTGGAHGLGFTEAVVYDRRTGERVEIGDIIKVDQESLVAVIDLIKEDLIIQKMERLSVDRKTAEGDLKFQGELSLIPSRENLGNFAVLPDGLVFHFPPYSVGAYVEGEYIVEIGWDKLAPYLNPDIEN